MTKIALCIGEPAGIGPDIMIKLAQEFFDHQLIAIGDKDLLTDRAKKLNLPIEILPVDSPVEIPKRQPGQLCVYHQPLKANVICGKPSKNNATYVLDCIKIATNWCLSKHVNAMVTGPVDKSVINASGIPFTGHTEFIAELTHTATPMMMLQNEHMRIALATTHLPLAKVPGTLTQTLLTEKIHILHHELYKRFHLKHPTIGVCGLNPHAGEGGYLGKEEINIITPTINALQKQGLNVIGPLPADTIFSPTIRSKFDVILAMYHDQGLAPLKTLGLDNIVNVTLGLPIIRTSVGHGTALDLAGTGLADDSSLKAALQLACKMAIG